MRVVEPALPMGTPHWEEDPNFDLDTHIHRVAHPGAYYSQTGTYRDKSKNAGGWPLESPNPHANDDEMAQRLYEHSRQLVGLEAA